MTERKIHLQRCSFCRRIPCLATPKATIHTAKRNRKKNTSISCQGRTREQGQRWGLGWPALGPGVAVTGAWGGRHWGPGWLSAPPDHGSASHGEILVNLHHPSGSCTSSKSPVGVVPPFLGIKTHSGTKVAAAVGKCRRSRRLPEEKPLQDSTLGHPDSLGSLGKKQVWDPKTPRLPRSVRNPGPGTPCRLADGEAPQHRGRADTGAGNRGLARVLPAS